MDQSMRGRQVGPFVAFGRTALVGDDLPAASFRDQLDRTSRTGVGSGCVQAGESELGLDAVTTPNTPIGVTSPIFPHKKHGFPQKSRFPYKMRTISVRHLVRIQ